MSKYKEEEEYLKYLEEKQHRFETLSKFETIQIKFSKIQKELTELKKLLLDFT